MVANNFFGLSKSLEIITIRLSEISSSKTDLDNEKNATSAPDINAEKNRSTKSKRKLIILDNIEVSIAKNEINKLAGSGSNGINF